MTTHLDHLMFGVADLAAARSTLAADGLPFAVGGDHPTGTHNALAVGPRRRSYVELIAVHPDAEGDLAQQVRRGGLTAYALGVDDIDAAVRDLAAAGFACAEVADGARTTEDGRQVRWRSAVLGPGIGRSELPFLIEWPTTVGHRTGLTPDVAAPDVVEIEIGSREPDRVRTLLTTLGLPVDGLVCSDGEVTMRIADAAPGLRSALLSTSDGRIVSLPLALAGPA